MSGHRPEVILSREEVWQSEYPVHFINFDYELHQVLLQLLINNIIARTFDY